MRGKREGFDRFLVHSERGDDPELSQVPVMNEKGEAFHRDGFFDRSQKIEGDLIDVLDDPEALLELPEDEALRDDALSLLGEEGFDLAWESAHDVSNRFSQNL
jgi:hypothetical protein